MKMYIARDGNSKDKDGECYELNFDKNHRIIPKIEKQPEEIKNKNQLN